MSRKSSDLACVQCGSNRLRFPHSDEGAVTCEDCGDSSQSLHDLKAQVSREMFGVPEQNGTPAPAGGKRTELRDRHTSEVDASQAEVRESIAETDRLVVESDRMLRRHRRECDDEEGA
jgi:ribosomal protein S27E